MQTQISWLLKKPTDLDLHCLQRQGISGFSRTRVKIPMRFLYKFYVQEWHDGPIKWSSIAVYGKQCLNFCIHLWTIFKEDHPSLVKIHTMKKYDCMDGRWKWMVTNHNSSPWGHCAQVKLQETPLGLAIFYPRVVILISLHLLSSIWF